MCSRTSSERHVCESCAVLVARFQPCGSHAGCLSPRYVLTFTARSSTFSSGSRSRVALLAATHALVCLSSCSALARTSVTYTDSSSSNPSPVSSLPLSSRQDDQSACTRKSIGDAGARHGSLRRGIRKKARSADGPRGGVSSDARGVLDLVPFVRESNWPLCLLTA